MSEDEKPEGLKLAHTKKGRTKKKTGEEAVRSLFRAALSQGFSAWPKMPRTFKVLVDLRGIRSFIEIGAQDICRYVAKDAVVGELVRYSIQDLSELDKSGELVLATRDAEELVKQWSFTQEHFDIKQIAPVRTAGESGLCWQRLPFNLAAGKTAAFDELFQAATNVLAIKQWIGSLFDADSPRQQYVYLHGDGGDGKGSLLDFLRRAFGPTYKAEQPPSKSDRFWTQGLLGMRVIAFDDLTEKKFITDSHFKSLTGGGPLRVEEKNGPSYDGDFIGKAIITSNLEPNISRKKADTRRIIYSKFEPRNIEYDERFKDRMWAEGAAFLFDCREAYLKLSHGAWIPTDVDAVEGLLGENEDDFEGILAQFFELKELAETPAGAISCLLKELAEMPDKQEQGKFRDFLSAKYGIKKKQLTRGGRWCYVGIAINPDALKELEGILKRVC